MFPRLAISVSALCLFAMVLTGCGVSPLSQSTGTQASPSLSGNYLLAGSLPGSPLPFSNAPFSLGATFDTIGSQIAAVYSVSVPCTTSTYGFSGGGDLTGTLASDGSFTLQSPLPVIASTAVTLTIKGVAPATKGAAWSGTYTLTTTNTFCPGTLTGAITATPIADVSGTYTGTTSLVTTGSLTGSLVNVNATLQQGIPVTSSFGSTAETRLSLSGTLSIKGSSCLTSGTPVSSTSLQGAVEGSTVFANFQMNDGSLVEMIGSIGAADASRLSFSFLTVTTGSCGLSFLSGPVTITR